MKQALIDNLFAICQLFGVPVQLRNGVNKDGFSWFSVLNVDQIIKDDKGKEMTLLEFFMTHFLDRPYQWIVTLPKSGQVISFTLRVSKAGVTTYVDQLGITKHHTKTGISWSQDNGKIGSAEDDVMTNIEQSMLEHQATNSSTVATS
tara:strand:- start:5 stop:445 length:441 start_codon:yes stop_codon:yes gene_type:complete